MPGTPYNVAKAVLCAVWLLPLRLACLVAAVGVAAAFGLLAACFVPVYPPGEEEPLPPALLLLFWPTRGGPPRTLARGLGRWPLRCVQRTTPWRPPMRVNRCQIVRPLGPRPFMTWGCRVWLERIQG